MNTEVKIFKGSRADKDLNSYCDLFKKEIVKVIKVEESFWYDTIITVLLKDKQRN